MLGGNQHHQEHHSASYVEVKTVSLLKPGPSSQQLLLPSIWGSASALGISLSLPPLLTHLPPPRNSQELGQRVPTLGDTTSVFPNHTPCFTPSCWGQRRLHHHAGQPWLRTGLQVPSPLWKQEAAGVPPQCHPPTPTPALITRTADETAQPY